MDYTKNIVQELCSVACIRASMFIFKSTKVVQSFQHAVNYD